jgi:hypothetical protein
MLLGMRLKKIVGFLLVLGIGGAIGMAPSKAEAQMLTPTAAARFGAANRTGSIIAMDAITTAEGKTYLVVLEQGGLVAVPFPPDDGVSPAPLHTTSSDSGDTAAPGETSSWSRAFRVVRLLEVTTEPWAELFSKEYEPPDWPVAVECLELPRAGGRDSVWIAVIMSDRIEYYDPGGTNTAETFIVDSGREGIKGGNAMQHQDDGQNVIFLVGGAGDNDGCVVCVAEDPATSQFEPVWTITLPATGPIKKIDCTSDGTSAYCVLLAESRDIYGNLISQTVSALEGATREDPGTIRDLPLPDDPMTEFVDVAGDRNPFIDSLAAESPPITLALANQKTPDGGTRAVLYYWAVDEFFPGGTNPGPVWSVQPSEPGGNVEGTCLLFWDGGDIRRGALPFVGCYVAGNTDGPILWGPRHLGGSDVWVARVEFDPVYTGLPSMRPDIELYGGAGDDTLGDMVLMFGDHVGFEKVPYCCNNIYSLYLGINVDSAHGVTFESISTQSAGGIGTDPTIVELKHPLAKVIEGLQQLIAANPDTPSGDKAEDALEKLLTALDELAKMPPDNQAAVGNIEGAVGDLEAAVKDELLDVEQGTKLLDLLTYAARQLAVDAIDAAIAAEADQDKIAEAEASLAEGDQLWADAVYKDAVNKYKDALAKAEGAL